MRSPLRLSLLVGLTLVAPALLGARGDGCAAASTSAAPDLTGTWAITYDDTLDVEITIGGAVTKQTVPAAGAVVTVDYQGTSLSFNLDCSRPEIVCPSESWPASVSITEPNAKLDHQFVVDIPQQTCSGTTSKPPANTCGAGTTNPDCTPVCDGTVDVKETQAFGVIGETGDSFRLFLGGGIVSNGLNCALLGYSVADANLTTEGQGTASWHATAMTGGTVTVGYAGGCLFVGDPQADATLEPVILGASLKFTTGFTGAPGK
jgi:hypothetical protein